MERIVSTAVKEAPPGTRLIDWLCMKFPYCREPEWEDHMETGKVTLNGKTCLPGDTVAFNDRITFDVSGFREPDVPLSFGKVFESAGIAIVDKPPLLPVHPSGRYFANTLWSLLKTEYAYVHISTRLDRETSGLVLACTDKETVKMIATVQGANGLKKEYLAVVHGDFPARMAARGFLVPDGKSEVRKKRAFVQDAVEGESCATSFSLLERKDGMSLVRAIPETGRTHQIRATLLSLGFPVAGDKLYGLDDRFFLRFADGTLTEPDRAAMMIPFQALHCERLSFALPDGRFVSAMTPPPPEWRQFGFANLSS